MSDRSQCSKNHRTDCKQPTSIDKADELSSRRSPKTYGQISRISRIGKLHDSVQNDTIGWSDAGAGRVIYGKSTLHAAQFASGSRNLPRSDIRACCRHNAVARPVTITEGKKTLAGDGRDQRSGPFLCRQSRLVYQADRLLEG